MIMTYLGTNPKDSLEELKDTIGCHARFAFLKNLYIHHLVAVVGADGDDAHVMHHRACPLRSYLMYLVDTSIFIDKKAYYVNMVYLKYFIDFMRIHEYNYGFTYLVYPYLKLTKGCLSKIKHMTTSCTLDDQTRKYTNIYQSNKIKLISIGIANFKQGERRAS